MNAKLLLFCFFIISTMLSSLGYGARHYASREIDPSPVTGPVPAGSGSSTVEGVNPYGIRSPFTGQVMRFLKGSFKTPPPTTQAEEDEHASLASDLAAVIEDYRFSPSCAPGLLCSPEQMAVAAISNVSSWVQEAEFLRRMLDSTPELVEISLRKLLFTGTSGYSKSI
jgi:hypothetical protein